MPTPRSRRALLTSVVPLALCLTGCFEGRLTSADDPATDDVESTARDCDAERPEPPARGDAIQPGTYPSPSASVLEDPVPYVLEFEEAYRRNALLDQYGEDVRAFDVRLEDSAEEAVEAESATDGEAALVSIVYEAVSDIGGHPGGREYRTRVTYYVDERAVLRARYGGIASEPTFDPDPREAGVLVACLE